MDFKYKKIIKLYTIILVILNIIIWGLIIAEKTNQKLAEKISQTKASLASLAKEKNKELRINNLLEQIKGIENGNFLILFQNNFELRPTGGYLGSFGILKIKNKKLQSFKTYDTVVLDSSSRFFKEPPQPIRKYLGVAHWQMRDSNWSPDFRESAQNVEDFYKNEAGERNLIFDGIIAINTRVLETVLKFIGPIYVEELGKNISYEDAILTIQEFVEIGYLRKGLKRPQRKNILQTITNKIFEKLDQVNLEDQRIIKDLENHLDQKDILLYLKNPNLDKIIKKYNWDGRFDKDWYFDFIGIVDSNMNSLKTDLFIVRSLEYSVDLTGEKPIANLKINYKNLAQEATWLARDYKSYTRIYLPQYSEIIKVNGIDDQLEYEEFNKKVVAGLVYVPIKSDNNIEIKYYLPPNIKKENIYLLKIVKQPGIVMLGTKINIHTPKKIKNFNPLNEGYQIEPELISFQKNLKKDEVFKVVY